ncbi:ribosome maturation factor RimP [Deinococcus peraridilitoris]|uniref:Ribosome maturation factor RimP n=1 Tax=Deinococcus peraridilitoris (strain DSM 19664 / LMG 22246 / CIP 109416 / KR-200) TaxID=937777 RepID=L0A4H6_DEIPD|nr:ribosome maturation factor RimP [Deinococcus peraridilitoris]AFZ68788.1 hypothetical protein Deipe_3348 [Deinococcus peraridilitoris DSM 19664]
MSSNLEHIAHEVLSPLGFEVLEVHLQNPGKRPTLLVRIDRLDEQPVTVEDLQTASDVLSLELDRLDPIQGEYRLELESPGAKRPLRRPRHFERMVGLKAKVRGGGHSFTAPILGVEGEEVTFDLNGEHLTLRASDIQANLAEFPPSHR